MTQPNGSRAFRFRTDQFRARLDAGATGHRNAARTAARAARGPSARKHRPQPAGEQQVWLQVERDLDLEDQRLDIWWATRMARSIPNATRRLDQCHRLGEGWLDEGYLYWRVGWPLDHSHSGGTTTRRNSQMSAIDRAHDHRARGRRDRRANALRRPSCSSTGCGFCRRAGTGGRR